MRTTIHLYLLLVALAAGPALAKPKAKDKKADAPKADKAEGEKAEKKPEAPKLVKETRPNGLKVEDVKLGDGMEAKEGSKVTMHYRGTFVNGKEFDSNLKEASPEPFQLDKNHLIAGWVEGVPGMKVHGKRKLFIPYKLAYGEQGTPDGTIPPRADLLFEIELLKVE